MQRTKLLIFTTMLLLTGVNAQDIPDDLTASINGTIQILNDNPDALASSPNGTYWCTYEIAEVTDEMRKLINFRYYKDEKLMFTLSELPGSDLEISNSGHIIFYDHSEHFKSKLGLIGYSPDGNFLFKKSFTGATLFNFSSSGNLFGVRTPDGISVINLTSEDNYLIEKGLQFFIDDDPDGGELIVVVQQDNILLYEKARLINTINSDMKFPRKVSLSAKHDLVCVIYKFNLNVYSLSSGELIFNDRVNGELSFRDIKVIDDKIVTGIHKKNDGESTGIIKIYDFKGNILNQKSGNTKTLKHYNKLNLQKKSNLDYNSIPWPFFPFDSMRTVWNHYEQHMGLGGSESYLHQGLDLITPIGEPTYSVIDGFIKLVLTIGGASYWRIAVSDTQSTDRSDGWLSAHLIENTIQFDVGDTVHVHDYLGDIIQWSSDWGHIHFVNITDSGLVWLYNDNEWGINFNPSLALQPYPDTASPYIDNVFTWSKFAFAVNESEIYIEPDSLFGNIDIIVKVVDYAGDSEWQQPAFTTWYTIKRLSDGEVIKARTLGHILNHKYSFYESGNYRPYAGVIYQRDYTLLPSGWMDMQRNYYHNLTNSDGDSVIDLSEKSLGFDTENYEDGYYRIIVEAYDDAGNFDIDSMDVQFKNGNPVIAEDRIRNKLSFHLNQNYPNPFNPSTKIKYTIPSNDKRKTPNITLIVYDVLGKEVATLVNEEKPAGEYEVEFDGTGLTGGIYFYQMRAGNFVQTRKMVLLK